MKLCIKCKHYAFIEAAYHKCTRNASITDPVTGEKSTPYLSCRIERKKNDPEPDHTFCGPEGKFWEDKNVR